MKNIFKHFLFVTVVFIFLLASASLVLADSDTDISSEGADVEMYTIDFYDIDNNLIESKTFPAGDLIVPPEMPETPDYVWINTEDESDILTETSTASKDACYFLVYLEEVVTEENEVVENATTFALTPDSEKVFTYNDKDYYDTDATTTYAAGDNITAYWYESDGVLGFVGTGDMHDNWQYNTTPWDSIKSNITNVYLSDEITSIGNYAFAECKNLTLTELPIGLTFIGAEAFNGCTNLALTGELPSGLTTIGGYAFDSCTNLALTGELPCGLTYIGNHTFYNCTNLALTGELPSGLTSIGVDAFYCCTNLALTGELPSGLITIGGGAFSSCTNLALTGELPSGLTKIGGSAFSSCTNLALTGELPRGLTSIGDLAFYGCKNLALSGELPSGLTSIGVWAFNGCTNLALTGELPSGLTSIGSGAFWDCTNLALTGELPSGLTKIGERAFQSCTNLALTGELPSGLTTIGRDAFADCKSLALTGELPSGLTSIGESAFQNCYDLALSGSLPSGLTAIGSYAFQGCTNLALTGELPSGLTEIGSNAFFDCTSLALTGDIPASLTTINNDAFKNVDSTKTHFDKNLSSVIITSDICIPTSYTVTDTFTDGKKADVVITKYGFVGASSVVGTASTYEGYTLKTDCTDTAITIGATDADRLSLTRVYEKSSTKIFTYNGKDYYDTDATTVYEAGADIKAYWYESDGVLGFVGTGDMYGWPYNASTKRDTTPWHSIKSNITDVYFSDEITTIGNWAFAYCTNLALTGKLPSGLTSIGDYAFHECDNLALTGELPSSLTSIGDWAFYCCTNLALSGELPSSLTSIGNFAFAGCANLALTCELPSGLTTIGKDAFGGCTNLALTGELPSGLTSIGGSAFSNCHNLALTGSLPSGLTEIGSYVFYDCTNLALSGELPSGLTTIGNFAFYGCTNLALTCELPSGLTSIGYSAFYGCSKLALTGSLPSELTEIGGCAFYDCYNLALTGSLPSGLTEIGYYTFCGCYNLALTGSLPSGLTEIGESAFYDCYSLALTGELPSGLTSIGTSAFHWCRKLALTGSLPSGLTSIGTDAFYGCTNLALTGELPSGLTSIGGAAFGWCENLALTGDIPASVTSIGLNAFYEIEPTKTHFDKNLSSVTITSDMKIPTSYTVTDTFTDGKKADAVTTKYGFVGKTTTEAGTAPTYEGYKLKTDCADAPITIGATDADRLTLTREYVTTFTAFKFLDADDNYITTIYAPAGSEVTAPDAPEVEGKRFLRWVDEEGEALPEISTGEEKGYTYHPEYTVDSSDYTVYIYDGSYGQPINKKLLKTLNFDEPTEITLDNYFEDSEPFDDGTYVRGYWNWTPYGEPLHKQSYKELHIGDKLMVNGPVELIVVYTNKRIDIKYINDDDSLIWYYRAGQTSRLIYPETPKHSKNPDIYTFDHWVDEYGNKYYPGKSELDYVSDSRTLKAVYTPNKYNITFRDYDNSIFFSSDVPFGEKIEVPEPKREGYTFTGWSPVFSGICNGKAEYTAQYKKNPIMYTIRFVDYNDNLIASNIYKEGSNIVIPISPTRDGYRFTGWTPNINNKAVASVTYKATYEKKEEVVTPTPTVPTTPSVPVTPIPTPPAPIEPIPVPKPAEEVDEPDDRISESDLPVKTPERVPETVPEKLPELNIEDVPVPKPADIKEKAPVKPVKQATKDKKPLDNIPKKNPLEEIATPIIRGVAITTLATGAIGVGLATTGGLSYWWLLLGCLLFKKKYPKILGIIPNSKRYVSHNNRPIKKKDVVAYYESFEDMAGRYSLADAIDRMNAQNCYSVIEKSLQRIEIIADDKLFTIEKSEFENLDKILCEYINFAKVEIRFVYDDAEYSVTFI